MAIKKNCSNHLVRDRMKRVEFIIENIGFGDIIAERDWVDTAGKSCIRQLTTTGVIIVLNPSDRKVITMWTASVLQVKAMYHGRIPNWMYRVVTKNEKIMQNFHE